MNYELGFEHLTKRQLVRFCKKFHKDCYRLVGQKMKLKDQLINAKELLKKMYHLHFEPCVTHKDLENRDKLFEEVEQFLNSEVEK